MNKKRVDNETMQKIKVSFIITVYKVEQYLRHCVDSIISQTYRNIEIILVDDGSPDGSSSLCDLLAKEDERIQVIHKSNGGASDARNTGIMSATGDYLVFVDGDDYWLGTNYLQKFVDVIEANSGIDFVGFNCKYYYPNDNRFSKWAEFPSTLESPVNKNVALLQLVGAGIFPVSACMKIIKRDLIIDKHLFFPVGQTAEDIPWFINLMDSSELCVFLNDFVYSYRQVLGGSSVTHNIGIKNVNCLIQILKNETELLPQRTFSNEAKDAVLSFLAYELIQAYTCIPSLDKKDAKIVFNELKSMNWLFAYTQNPKVKMVNSVRKLLGIRMTIRFLKFYVKHRR